MSPLFNTDDHVYSTDELIDLADGAGALLSCHSAHLDAAEIALLLMLGAARRATEGNRPIRARQWRLRSPAFMVGTQITGKASGIIRMGRLARVTAARRARGALIDDEALQEALRSGQVAAAGLDVFNGEPRTSTRATGSWTTLSCCPISAAPPAKPATPWVSGHRAIWTRYSPAGSRRIVWHDGLPVLYMAGQPL